MGITERKWTVHESGDSEKVGRLATELGVDRVLAELLVQRGVETFEQARRFFRPSLDDLHDPFLMKDMDKAVERLHEAITKGQKILVYGDYDVDGTTAVALVYSFVRRFTKRVEYYIPDRYDEGYGVSYKGLDWASDNGINLLITLDCGIKAIEKVEYARSKGIDVIICDHHLPEDELPGAVAVLDPKREDDHYPFDDLCGCGVGFKFVQGYSQKYNIDFETLEPLLDLQVVSIASDLVSMVGENRVLAHFGLKRLNDNPRKGLLAMLSLAKLEPGHVTIDDIVFKIGPRINAAGRMESGRLAVELLTAMDDRSAFQIGEKINDNNNERKNIDREITQEALEMVQNGTALETENVTIVYNPTWNKGVVGIVASRLVEAYYKPTVVLTKSNGFITGSARSVAGFDLYASIESCADLLENFGGRRRPDDEGRAPGRVLPADEPLRLRQHHQAGAHPGGGHRRPPGLFADHSQVLPHPQAVPALRPRQLQPGIPHRGRLRRRQRPESGRRRRAPEAGPDAGIPALPPDPGHRLQHGRLLRPHQGRQPHRRMLLHRRELLPRFLHLAAAAQGHAGAGRIDLTHPDI